MKTSHLNENLIGKVSDQLFSIEGSLKGLSGLFILATTDLCLDKNELFGIGQLLQILSNETLRSKKILDCDYENHLKAELEELAKEEQEETEDNSKDILSDPEFKKVSEQFLSLIKKFSTKKME